MSGPVAHVRSLPDPPDTARALLFDCDGTLVDTMGLHRRVWSDLLGVHGFVVSDPWWERHANDPMEPFVRAAVPDADGALIERLRVAGNDGFVIQRQRCDDRHTAFCCVVHGIWARRANRRILTFAYFSLLALI